MTEQDQSNQDERTDRERWVDAFNAHRPARAAVVKRSGGGITLTCHGCDEHILTSDPRPFTIRELHDLVAEHCRAKATELVGYDPRIT